MPGRYRYVGLGAEKTLTQTKKRIAQVLDHAPRISASIGGKAPYYGAPTRSIRSPPVDGARASRPARTPALSEFAQKTGLSVAPLVSFFVPDVAAIRVRLAAVFKDGNRCQRRCH